MDLDLTQYYMPLVMIACLIIGYCIKHISWLERVGNEYIPTILAVAGAALACMANSSLSLQNIVYGALTGLASTGMHQMFKQMIIESGEKE